MAIRALVADAEQRPDVVASNNFEAWRTWALTEANQLDPFLNGLSALIVAAPNPI